MPRVIPFGKYKGTPIPRLPADYVHWLLRQNWINDNLRSSLCDHPGLEALYREVSAAERRRPKKRYSKPFSLPPGFNLKPRLQAKQPAESKWTCRLGHAIPEK